MKSLTTIMRERHPVEYRDFVRAVEREKFGRRPLTPEEIARVNSLTIGERFNFRLIEALCGPEYAESYRAGLGL